MVVPHQYRTKEIVALYQQKQRWIERQRTRLQRSAQDFFQIDDDQMLLLGQGYRVVRSVRREEGVDHSARLIRSSLNLLDQNEQQRWYRAYARCYLTERIHKLSDSGGFHFNRLFIRNQKTRWGSCSSLKNISLNWKLVKAPVFVSDYVIYHELVHTRIMNHGQRFWLAVQQVAPQFQEAKVWLRENGHCL